MKRAHFETDKGEIVCELFEDDAPGTVENFVGLAHGEIIRLGTKTNVNGTSRYPESGDLPISVKGSIPPGSSRMYQVWYRNATSFCTASTFNLTNGIDCEFSSARVPFPLFSGIRKNRDSPAMNTVSAP